MRAPIFVRALTDEERARLEAGVRSSQGFVVRRCQIVLASARGERVPRIARAVGCDPKTARDVVHGFNADGLAILTRGTTRPHAPRVVWTPQAPTALPALVHRAARAPLATRRACGHWRWWPRSVAPRG